MKIDPYNEITYTYTLINNDKGYVGNLDAPLGCFSRIIPDLMGYDSSFEKFQLSIVTF